jgi:hypothetical protein
VTYTASNGMVINEQWTEKDVEGYAKESHV